MAGGRRLICAPGDLADGGPGVRFEIASGQAAAQGFAIRFRGEVHAFLNTCPHLGTQLDWQPGEFFDMAGLYLVCSTHGALFEPGSGLCIAGPCRGASLARVRTVETADGVYLVEGPTIA